ncbi:MAG TPA: hypothetical protein DEA57_03860 [Sulfurihydrogenibium sp.]|nr:hypothetical protein [Sulfurihydrogenibium sp.]
MHTLGEKLGIFIEFKKEILRIYVLRMTGMVMQGKRSFGLQPQDDKATLICHSEHKRRISAFILLLCHSGADEESPTFIEFLIRRIKIIENS